MKVFLDDIRTIDDSLGYIVVRDYDSCIEILSAVRNILEFVSLDYSLGTEKTGYDVLVYLMENDIHPKHINIHSDHPEGVPMMRKFAEKIFQNSLQ
ncbi:MAG: cyclic-phosphate processing receiver domain-containing protein [Erysipelotrichaceae bacterium]